MGHPLSASILENGLQIVLTSQPSQLRGACSPASSEENQLEKHDCLSFPSFKKQAVRDVFLCILSLWHKGIQGCKRDLAWTAASVPA